MAKGIRSEMEEQLAKRAEEAYGRKDDTGKYRSYFRTDIEGISYWKPDKGDHIIDILPYKAGNNDPNAPKGEWQYVLDIWVHQKVGINEDNYVCLARNYNKLCPICKHQDKLRREEDFDEDLVKSLSPKRRTVYNVIVYDNKKETDKGVQVFEVAHWFMEKHLLNLMRDKRTGEKILFYLPSKKGKSISFTIEEGSFVPKGSDTPVKSAQYEAHKLEDRDYDLDEEDLKDVYCLDDIIERSTFDEIKRAFWGEDEDDEPKENPFDEPESEEKEKPVRGRGRNKIVKEEEEEEKPKKEKESTKPKREKESNDCPHGGVFGDDLDTLDECNDCDVYDSCSNKYEEIQEGLESGNKEPKSEPEQEPEPEPEPEPEEKEKPVRGRRSIRR